MTFDREAARATAERIRCQLVTMGLPCIGAGEIESGAQIGVAFDDGEFQHTFRSMTKGVKAGEFAMAWRAWRSARPPTLSERKG